MMLKRLHKYILRIFIGPWLASFFICVFLLLMQFLWKYIDDLVGKGLEWNVIMELLFYASLTLIPMALPLSILLAAIMTYGGLGEKNELFAMKSGGVSLIRLIYPLLVLNIMISVGAFYFANNLLPYTNLKMRSLLYSIQQQRPEISLQSGIFTEPVDDFVIKVDRKHRRNNGLENILIYDHRNKSGNTNVTTADFGNLKMSEDETVMILDLFDGYRYEEIQVEKSSPSSSKYPHQRSQFKRKTVFIELDGLGLDRNNEELFKSGFEMLNNKQLLHAVDSLNQRLRKRETDIWFNLTEYSLFKAKHNWHPEDEALAYIADKHLHEVDLDVDVDESGKYFIDYDSIYLSMNSSQKNKVIDFALNYGRSAKTYVEVVQTELTGYKRWIARHDIEYHRKFVLSFACLLFFLLGAPLGAIIRKGGFGLPVIISVIVFLFYYIISITFEKMVRELVLVPETGMWISTIIILPLSLYMLKKASTDSMRLSPHFYEKFQKLFLKKRNL
jgi:lipopolysaccharide export system permease protein